MTASIGRSFIQVVCLMTGPKPLPKRAVHIVRSRASSFKWEYHLLSLRSSSSFLRLLISRLPVTSIPLFIFSSITRCRRQFLRKMWPIIGRISMKFVLGIFIKIFLKNATSIQITIVSQFTLGPKHTYDISLNFSCVQKVLGKSCREDEITVLRQVYFLRNLVLFTRYLLHSTGWNFQVRIHFGWGIITAKLCSYNI